jgi:hypothetical protein
VCAATGIPFPPEHLVGAHLFKHAWAAEKQVLKLPHIDHERNGLVFCKGVEHAFDNSQICFYSDSFEVKLHVLDPSLRSKGVIDRSKELLGAAYTEPDNAMTVAMNPTLFKPGTNIQTLTFGNLEGRPLTVPIDKQPFNRCLCFQAHQARKEAVARGWIKSAADWDFTDYWTEGATYVEKVKAWQTYSQVG